MKRVKSFANIVTTYILFISLAQASGSQLSFSPEQEAKIGEIAANYLVAHPEVLVSVSQRLQQQQKQREQMSFAVSVMENQATLLNDAATPVYGCHFQKATAQNSEAECTTSVNVPIGVGWRGAGSKLNEWSFRLTRSFVATF